MKSYLFVIFTILISLSSPAASTENEVTVKRSERKEDGKVIRKTESFFRNGKQILLTVKTLDKQGRWRVSRSYEIDKNTSVTESDEDGDGHFEALIIFHGKGKSLEAFERLKNGDVLPFSPEKLKALRAQYAQLGEFFEQDE